MAEKKCDCSECHNGDDLMEAIRRLESRDAANERIINEMYAKIAQLTDTIYLFITAAATPTPKPPTPTPTQKTPTPKPPTPPKNENKK